MKRNEKTAGENWTRANKMPQFSNSGYWSEATVNEI